MVSMQVLEERWFMAERRRQERRQRNRERWQRRQLNTEHLTARTHLPLPPSPTHTHTHTLTHTHIHTHRPTPHHPTPHHTTPPHPTPPPPHPSTTTNRSFSSCYLFCVAFCGTPAVAMSGRDGGSSAWRRRQRRLRSMLRHERQTVAMELAAALHHSRDVVPAQHVGQRAQKTANSAGARPGVLKNPEPQGGAVTVGYVAAPEPLLVVSSMAGGDAVGILAGMDQKDKLCGTSLS